MSSISSVKLSQIAQHKHIICAHVCGVSVGFSSSSLRSRSAASSIGFKNRNAFEPAEQWLTSAVQAANERVLAGGASVVVAQKAVGGSSCTLL